MQVWRLHIRPRGGKEGVCPIAFCLKESVVGIGWPVDGKPSTPEEYFTAGANKYGDRGWKTAANAFVWNMKEDDLVWFRDWRGVYYLARVAGPWQYRGEGFSDTGIYNTRKAEIVRIGPTAPGKVVSSFVASMTVRRIPGESVAGVSMLEFNHYAGRQVYNVEPRGVTEVFDLLNAEELEDIVGLFLQKTRGWMVVPSTRTRRDDTMFYEYGLVDAEGSWHFVQVKSGETVIDLEQYASFAVQMVVFGPAGYQGRAGSNTEALNREELEAFCLAHQKLLPGAVVRWFEGESAGYEFRWNVHDWEGGLPPTELCESIRQRADEDNLKTQVLCFSDPDAEPFEWDCPARTAELLEGWFNEFSSPSPKAQESSLELESTEPKQWLATNGTPVDMNDLVHRVEEPAPDRLRTVRRYSGEKERTYNWSGVPEADIYLVAERRGEQFVTTNLLPFILSGPSELTSVAAADIHSLARDPAVATYKTRASAVQAAKRLFGLRFE